MVQPPSTPPGSAEVFRRLEHYERQSELAKEYARRRQVAFNEVVDFVEAHGGALSGEQRGTLWELCVEMSR